MNRGGGPAREIAAYLESIGAASLAGEDLVAALARRNGESSFDVDGLALEPELLRLVPEDLTRECPLLPIHRSGRLLFVAVPDGAVGPDLEQLEQRLGLSAWAVAVSEIDVLGVLIKARQLLRRRERASASASPPAVEETSPPGPGLDRLGLPEVLLDRLRAILSAAPGLLLLSGPAGSGKSTTLAAISGELRRRGLRTARFDRGQGVGALEEALRSDLDALAVDETESPALAARALRAAVEGRRVIFALPTSDVLSARARLEALGVDRHLVATAFRAGLNQRLLRGVCPDCAELRPEDPQVLEDLRLEGLLGGVPLCRGRGCAACGRSGLRGRVPIFEYGERSADGGIRGRFQPLIADGLAKLLAGRISLRELTEQVPFTQVLQAADRLSVRRLTP